MPDDNLIEKINELLPELAKQIRATELTDDTLATGKLGKLLFQAVYATSMQPEQLPSVATELEQIYEQLETSPLLKSYSLMQGVAGLAYVTRYLQQNGVIQINENDLLAPLDRLLHGCAERAIQQKKVDFLSQAGGVIHYFVEYYTQLFPNDYLHDLIDKLLANAGTTPPAYYGSLASHAPKTYDLGLAHGLSGLLIVLINLGQKGEITEDLWSFITTTTDYIVEQLSDQKISVANPVQSRLARYPCTVDTVQQTGIYINRLGWCYSDINLLLLLYRVQDLVAAPRYEPAITKLNNALAQRLDPQQNEIYDAHFCHGAAGIAQLYQSIHQYSQLPLHQQHAKHWLQLTCEYLERDLFTPVTPTKSAQLLEGYAGTGLVLLSYLRQERIGWESLFLL